MIKFRMAKINVEQFAILTDNPPVDNITYTIGIDFKYSLEGKRIACVFSFSFNYNDNDKDYKFITLNIMCEFDIHPSDWQRSIKDNKLTVKKDMLGFFANQTVGVARGILHCKTEGTPFNGYIIPPVNLTEFIDQDLVASAIEE